MRVRRGQLTDFYVEGDQGVANVGGKVVFMSEMAAVIVEATSPDRWTPLSEVAATLVGTFGEPEPPHTAFELTVRHVKDLAEHGILQLDPSRG